MTVARPTSERRWAVGVTTVPSRLDVLLPQTLHSLKRAGFPEPRLFVDGVKELEWCGLEVTCRFPAVGAYPNWFLALHELVVRDPSAHYYAMFQDDLVCAGNLRILEPDHVPGEHGAHPAGKDRMA